MVAVAEKKSTTMSSMAQQAADLEHHRDHLHYNEPENFVKMNNTYFINGEIAQS